MKTGTTLLLSIAINAAIVCGVLSYKDWSAYSAKQAAIAETKRLEAEAKREAIEHQISQVYEAWKRGEFVPNRQILDDLKGANGWGRRNEIEIEVLHTICGELRSRVKELENEVKPPRIGYLTNSGSIFMTNIVTTNFFVPGNIVWSNLLLTPLPIQPIALP